MIPLGDEVLRLIQTATRRVTIVAPFIKVDALERLINDLPADVELVVVTRWRVADLVAGVSDLGVYDVVSRCGGTLYTRTDLHAKLFVADDQCLVGSANVTLAGLGWAEDSNLELLTIVRCDDPQVIAFKEELFGGVIPVFEWQRAMLDELVSRIAVGPTHTGDSVDGVDLDMRWTDWVPRAMNPEDLFSVYSDTDSDVGRMTQDLLAKEIKRLGVVPGLDADGFRTWVQGAMIQSRLVMAVVARIEESGKLTEVDMERLLVRHESAAGLDAREVLEALQRWLTHFLPDQYQTAPDSIKLIRARRL